MDKKKLNAKDFINIGIFTVIYFVMFFITGMLGYIPIFAVIIPLVLGILGGIPFMLFLTKTGKFGAATIMGTLVSVLCFLMGQSWISIPFGIVFGFLADLIFKAGEYKSWKHTVLGYCVFTEWVIGSMLPMWIMRDTFFEAYRSKGGTDEYINAVMGLTANWMLPVVIVLGLVAMQRMHIPEAFIIPFSVMFRFFPTISEEAGSIGNAMRMRGITGKNFFKNPQAVLEYRIVPLMMSVVTIGNDLSAAALTRGLGNGKKRTSICKIGFHWKDFALMIIVTAALLVFLLF